MAPPAQSLTLVYWRFITAFSATTALNSSFPGPGYQLLLRREARYLTTGFCWQVIRASSKTARRVRAEMIKVITGAPGVGAAIYNVGTTIVADCTFFGNSAVGGNGAFNYFGTSGGADAQGGAIFNNGTMIVLIRRSSKTEATGGIGGKGVLGQFGPSGTGAMGGNGCGGALYSAAGSVIVVNSTFVSNSAAGGAGGTGGSGEESQLPGDNADLNGGTGGTGRERHRRCLWLSNAFILLTNVTFSANSVSVGALLDKEDRAFLSAQALEWGE